MELNDFSAEENMAIELHARFSPRDSGGMKRVVRVSCYGLAGIRHCLVPTTVAFRRECRLNVRWV